MELIQFRHPFTCLVAGPTSSGKTVLIKKILEHSSTLIPNLPHLRVLWCYGEWQSFYVDTQFVKFVEGFPTLHELSMHSPTIVIIDDLMSELEKNRQLSNLFTKLSHHRKISVFFVVQNLFHRSTIVRTVSLNSHYIILMKNPRDKSQAYHLGRQLYPCNLKRFVEAYEDATKEPYSYIKIDLTPQTPEDFRLQTCIVPGEGEGVVVYLPKCPKT